MGTPIGTPKGKPICTSNSEDDDTPISISNSQSECTPMGTPLGHHDPKIRVAHYDQSAINCEVHKKMKEQTTMSL